MKTLGIIRLLSLSDILMSHNALEAHTIGPEDNVQEENRILPLVPEAASLVKMVEYPVNYNTGVPDIKIPLFNIESQDLTLPLELVYHSGGFKINEEPTAAGLGWSLSSEIQITRVIYGKDDLLPKGYIDPSHTQLKGVQYGNLTNNAYPFSGESLSESCYRVAMEYDGLPDKFYYKLLNKSGAFFFCKNSLGNDYHIVCEPDDNIRIELKNYDPTFSDIDNTCYFEITDSDGTLYRFGIGLQLSENTEDWSNNTNALNGIETRIHNTKTGFETNITTWKCVSIENRNNTSRLQFEYDNNPQIHSPESEEKVEYIEELIVNRRQNINILEAGYKIGNYNIGDEPYYNKLLQTLSNYDINQFTPRYITRSNGGSSYIHFPYFGLNEGMVEKLRKMRFRLPQTAPVTSIQPVRLKKISSAGGSVNFSYNGAGGYLENIVVREGYGSGNEIKSFRLKQAYLNESELVFMKDGSVVPFDINYNSRLENDYYKGVNYLDTLEIRKGAELFETYAFVYNRKYCFGKHLKGSDAWGYVNNLTKLKNHTDSLVTTVANIDKTYSWPDINGLHSADFSIGSKEIYELASEEGLRKGVLKRIVYPTGGYVDFDFEANRYSVKKQYYGTFYSKNLLGGGLRVKTISYFSGKNRTADSHKYFRYGEYESGTGYVVDVPFGEFNVDHSSYLTREQMGYTYSTVSMMKIERNPADKREYHTKYTTYMPSSASTRIFANGSPVFYPQVSIYNKEYGTESGKTVYEYYMSDSVRYAGANSARIAGTTIPQIKTSWNMGNLKSISDFEYSEGKFKIVHKKELFYKASFAPVTPRAVYAYVHTFKSDDYGDSHYDRYGYTWGEYNIPIGKMLLERENEIWYYPSGNSKKSTQYEYNRLLPTHIKLSDNGKTIEETTMKYPFHYPSDSVFSKMEARNIIDIVIEKKSVSGSSSVTKYNNYQINERGYVVPSDIRTSWGDGPAVTEMTFDLYDSRGNILQTRDKSGLKTAYIWGYSDLYPVAEVKGCSYETAYLTIRSANLSSPNDNIVRAGLRPLYDIPNKLVKTFTYKPLVGVTSVTDNDRSTTYYTYDNIGRLIYVSDDKQKDITKYDYSTGTKYRWSTLIDQISSPLMYTFQRNGNGTNIVYSYNIVFEGGKVISSPTAVLDSIENHYHWNSLITPKATPDLTLNKGNCGVLNFGFLSPAPDGIILKINFIRQDGVVATKILSHIDQGHSANIENDILYLPAGDYTVNFETDDHKTYPDYESKQKPYLDRRDIYLHLTQTRGIASDNIGPALDINDILTINPGDEFQITATTIF